MTRMLPTDIEIEYLVGKGDRSANWRPLKPYDELVCEWLSKLSNELISDAQAKQYADVISFAYWCRKANIERLKDQFIDDDIRLGVGMVFHVTPSNVPINFAFSYVLSLLAGNANIVRVPSRAFAQTDIVCKAINKLLGDVKYKRIAEMTVFVKYDQNESITGALSSECNARIIWGGDEAINSIRKLPIPERSIEIAFADSYSLCVMDPNAIVAADDTEIKRLAESFYNDTYLMDQNACSSPHLIVWLNTSKKAADAKQRFWGAVYEVTASKYELHPVNAVDKYMMLCQNAIELNNIASVERHGNYVYRIAVDTLPDDMDRLRGRFGYFYEYETDDIHSLAHIVNTRYQTLTYFGVDRAELVGFVVENGLTGIDRIVPVGKALDMDVIWDGYDIVRTLSRIIDVK